MLRVGLTGSIAVGKSYVTGLLAEFGCRVLDADVCARRVVEPGTEGLRAVAAEFGPGVLQADGTLDRARLSSIVFADAARRARLNAILHPLIWREQDDWLRRCEEEDPLGVAVVDAALLIESGGYRRFDKVVVVHCRPEVQLERLMRRDGLTLAEAERRAAAQMPQGEKLRYADYSVDTSEGFEDTRRQTAELHRRLLELAQRPHADLTGESASANSVPQETNE